MDDSVAGTNGRESWDGVSGGGGTVQQMDSRWRPIPNAQNTALGTSKHAPTAAPRAPGSADK